MDKLGAHKQIAYDFGIIGNGQLHGIFNAFDRCRTVNVGAHSAGALGKEPCIVGIAALENRFNAPEKRA